MRLEHVALLLLLGFAAQDAASSAVTPAGMTRWKIVCAPGALPSERYAAEEFQRLFALVTGSTLPIVDSDLGPVICMGHDAVAACRGGGAKIAAWKPRGDEDLRISVSPNRVCIDGGRPRGTLYGVYEFFEEYLGVRFLTYDHTYVPKGASGQLIPPGVRTFAPTFAFRWPYYGETSRRPDFAARLRCNTVSDDPRLGGRTGFRLVNHNIANLVPPAKYAASHPEYYALVNGKRPISLDGGGPQLCLTNPDVLDVVTESVLAEVEANPAVRNVNIAQMDNANYCTCARCAALDESEGSHAGSMLAFVNAVAERVVKTHPDVLLGTFAYWYTRKPPRTLRAHPNVMVQLCSIECCDFHAIDDASCGLNREFCHDMAVWKTKCDKVFIWHYNTNFSCYMLPFPNLKSIGRSVAYFARNNGRGVFMQAAGNGFSTELSDLRNYVMARCLWKPGRDSWKEAREFCRLHYAESAGPILKYLEDYHRAISRAGLHPTCFSTESALHLDGPTTRMVWDCFAEALRLARTDGMRERVEKASLCALRAALSASSSTLSYADGVCKPSNSAYAPDLLDRYATLCDRYGAAMESETVRSSAFIDSLRSLFSGLRAVQVANATWRVTVLPESNGKIVEMLHLPTGRNVVQHHRSFNRFRYEDWVRDGEGPSARSTLPFEVVETHADRLVMALTTPDGTRFERTVSVEGDAVRIEGQVTAARDRTLDIWLHPEYDAATASPDPRAVAVYVKAPEWVQANKGWKDGRPSTADEAVLASGIGGGAMAYFSRAGGFGVEQRFDPALIGSLGLYWSPARLQVNLEMTPRVGTLRAGQSTRFWYEVRYLARPPGSTE